jgi:hypothetical protein
MASVGPATPGGAKFDFPSAASIPPVSIMNAEPGVSASETPKPAPSKHPAAPRRSSQREAAAPAAAHAPPAGALPPPPPPTQIAPSEPAPVREQPDTHATH